ncbi:MULTISPECIES: MtrB/PioB family outer membrane beta-barrel protein [unclassified Oleiphilus]|uniref:MtrB/PioB family outer membrane beta-barrel protein n=3 Tax=Oleiphilus TaxID=141450 RepID=UPI0018D274BF|nr:MULTISPECIES: MtrB/PioB family outer membrane beta-barrel protein [unclassified Oleiphilus]
MPVLAAEYTAVLSNSVEYTDNIGLASDVKDQDTVHTLSLSAGVVEERKTFQTNANFTLEKDHYYSGSYEGETTLSTGLGLLNFDLIEDFLSWQTSFTRSQTLDDPLEQARPGNLGHRDTLSSGPSITYVVSPTTYLTGEGSYTIVENSQSNTSDTQRADFSAAIAHQINSITGVNLTGQYEVMLDADGTEKYDRIQLGVGFFRQFVDGSVSLSAGRTQLVPEESAETESNFYSLSFNRQQLWLHDVTLSYLEDISDASIGFEVTVPGISSFAADGNDIVKRRVASLSIAREFGVYDYGFNFSWEYENYELQNEDEKIKEASFSIGRDIFSDFSMGFNVEFNQTDYLEQAAVGKDYTATYQIDADYQFSPSLRMGGFIQHETRRNSQNAVREYEELSVGISLNWTLI